VKCIFANLFRASWLMLCALGSAGCQTQPTTTRAAESATKRPTESATTQVAEPTTKRAAAPSPTEPSLIKLTSTAFAEGQPIPRKYTGEGEDVSPPLAWANLPKGTKELALICDDPDAPSPAKPRKEPWVHWVIYKMPADAAGLPEGVPRELRLQEPAGAMQGVNSWDKGENEGYRGPMPPPGSGTHRYFFKLYALDAPLRVKRGLDKPGLLKAMEGHVLGECRLVGTYERKK
jgi:Raf kinase inhibitor-like YbhB/YbcL family protein